MSDIISYMTSKMETYKVVLEVMAPVELTYKVMAESPEEAIEKIKSMSPVERPKPILSKSKRIAVKVYKWFFVNLLYSKRF